MSNRRNKALTYAVAAGAGLVWAARQIREMPPRPQVAARARMAAHSGPWTHGYATLNGVRLHYAEIGRGNGPLVILLHGFPQCWYQWRYVMAHLADRFHLVAPDMRGYNESDKPFGVDAYATSVVSRDIAGLIDALGAERAHLVGHDWGGMIAWHLGAHYPDKLDKLAVINAPHPRAYAREMRSNPEQLARSLYVLFFQVPVISDAALRLSIRSALPSTANIPGAFPPEALDVYENAVSQPGAVTAMLRYYRAAVKNGADEIESMRTIEVPTLLLWGMKDVALVPALAEGLDEWVPGIKVVRVDDSGHWLPEEKPRAVSDALAAFLGS